ncbi:ribosomal protein S12 methylthiotransferase accessory factor [Rhizobium tibeticum]|uniref:Putative methanogenesis marker protein 1 n=1 Tax=Rhizobium tibeticum TaxID=501024 RepID=A0A1H8RW79_9HYPH|nr:YcaO-like family protein [Rhizobium tibeticum]SEI08313.1 putative methanogenesis marker protein 1 [Rhizobium tibeticum]SEO70408.1 ribosomal protein S12 methylthiotransferase accessory factor [Rhizobium tibeticum]
MSSTGEPTDGTSDNELLGAFAEEVTVHLSSPLAREAEDDPGIYLRGLLPMCRHAGITRIADLTGLDRLTLPAVQTIRPNALSEVTSLGRGRSIQHAAIGAIMEALERYYAELLPAKSAVLASADELAIPEGLFDTQLVNSTNAAWRQTPTLWIAAHDLRSGSRQMVPLELVHTRYTDPPPDFDGLFLRNTTGLACHSTWHQAAAHALFECIERDAIARAFSTHGFFDRHRLAPESLGAAVNRRIGLLAEHSISVGFWLAPSPTGIAVVWCQSIEIGAGHPALALPTEGYCAGQNLHQAAENALLEALATRAGAISGARDDQTAGHYHKRVDGVIAKARQLILEPVSFTPVAEIRSVSTLQELLDYVTDAALGPVLAILLGSNSDGPVRCVRILMPRSRPFSIMR